MSKKKLKGLFRKKGTYLFNLTQDKILKVNEGLHWIILKGESINPSLS